jgi:hypothetical protein
MRGGTDAVPQYRAVMSIPVELPTLVATMATYGNTAFLLTGGDDGRPHIAHVVVGVTPDGLSVGAGRTSSANAQARPQAALLFAPVERGGYSLIVDVDALAARDGAGLLLTPTGAVLHRAAVGAEGDTTNDCAPVGD